ncbi:MAG TPA: hypothetical protein VHS99_20950 [Chloroflexota bacterium]|nr:hypothetical protein [Chloroflexota bacterium]
MQPGTQARLGKWGAIAAALGGAAILVFAGTLAPRLSGSLGAPRAPQGPQAHAAAASLPPLPSGWPGSLQLGTHDSPGGAATMRETTSYAFRYQYLAGGVNTDHGWATWNPGGAFVTSYVKESYEQGLIPVFTYYMIYQSAPGSRQSEKDGVYTNLQNTATMLAYYLDLKLFFERAGEFPAQTIVLHVEPDLWGYIQQRTRGDDAASVPVKVAATEMAELSELPDTMAGFARAVVTLRDRYAPNVLLGYHLSTWGTGNDILYSKPSEATVHALATRAGTFYRSLGAAFDIAFGEFSDRDAAFKEHQYKDGGASWWRPDDYARHVRFLSRFVQVAQARVVLWQIPFGNTRMRAMNNTWNHYQDNKVEWLLDEPARTHLQAYLQAGVVAFLFGRGADGATCACDANRDGVTNPVPINGNTGESLNADDDGGFFHDRARRYYEAGALPLPGRS